MIKRSQDGRETVLLGEAGALLQAVVERLRAELPDDYKVFESRVIDGNRRKDVVAALGIGRPADVNERVDAAKRFLVSLLPPRSDLI